MELNEINDSDMICLTLFGKWTEMERNYTSISHKDEEFYVESNRHLVCLVPFEAMSSTNAYTLVSFFTGKKWPSFLCCHHKCPYLFRSVYVDAYICYVWHCYIPLYCGTDYWLCIILSCCCTVSHFIPSILVQCDAGSFLQHFHNRYRIFRPRGRGKGCLLWVQSLTNILLLWLQ